MWIIPHPALFPAFPSPRDKVTQRDNSISHHVGREMDVIVRDLFAFNLATIARRFPPLDFENFAAAIATLGTSGAVDAVRHPGGEGSEVGAGFAHTVKTLRKEPPMAGEADKAKGRIKEAAGALTDDNKLRREGKIDQAAGKTKDAVNRAVDAVKKVATGQKGR